MKGLPVMFYCVLGRHVYRVCPKYYTQLKPLCSAQVG